MWPPGRRPLATVAAREARLTWLRSERLTRIQAIARLDAAVDAFARTFLFAPPPAPVYPGWRPHEVLAHLVFWHETYARILQALNAGREPVLMEGVFREFNRQAVDRLRNVPEPALLERLRHANLLVGEGLASLPPHARIRIKEGSKPRGPVEFANAIQRHFRGHLDHLRHVTRTRKAS
jgi:Mycothiol maleylpyruvate isomerase N-terminal domain